MLVQALQFLLVCSRNTDCFILQVVGKNALFFSLFSSCPAINIFLPKQDKNFIVKQVF